MGYIYIYIVRGLGFRVWGLGFREDLKEGMVELGLYRGI